MLKRKNKKYLKLAVLLIVLIFGIFLLTKLSSIASVVFQVVFNNKIELRKSDHNINILVLGKAGGQHEGPDLTDTIIFSSLDTKNKE
jgi:anionic cell wall polymer biosynthesis LytR-Cps2A-Psr (LCP) family protein